LANRLDESEDYLLALLLEENFDELLKMGITQDEINALLEEMKNNEHDDLLS